MMHAKITGLLLWLFPLTGMAQSGAALVPDQGIVIGEKTIVYLDQVRNRKLITELWYPVDNRPAGHPKTGSAENNHYGNSAALKENYPFIVAPTVRDGAVETGKHPLILLSHGTGGGRLTLEWLADILVRQGYIVAAPDHWGNTFDHKIPLEFVTPWQRPLDISFVLTQLLADPVLGFSIDSKRIGAAGFSLGGYTVLALAGAKLNLDALIAFSKTPEGAKEMAVPEFPDLLKTLHEAEVRTLFIHSRPLQDKRIKAFFAIAPAIGQGFTDLHQMSEVQRPVYLVGAGGDHVAPLKTNVEHYHALLPKSTLYIFAGEAGHYVFLNEAIEELKRTGAPMFNDNLSVNRAGVHEYTGKLAIQFFQKSLSHK